MTTIDFSSLNRLSVIDRCCFLKSLLSCEFCTQYFTCSLLDDIEFSVFSDDF